MNATSSRPIAITVICVIGFLGLIPSFLRIFSPITSSIGAWYPWYPPYLALASIVRLVSLIGMWLMKKWGVYAYTFTSLTQIVLLAKGLLSPPVLLIPFIVIVIGFSNLKKMS